jgi:hypothetical protein
VCAAAVAIAISLTGCSGAQQSAGQSGKPKTGDCWSVTYAASQKNVDWEGKSAVPCSADHEAYTFAVPRIHGTFTGSWLAAKNTVRTDVNNAAYAACVRQAAIDLPGLQTLGLLRLNYYLPSVALWNGGARWVRCDIIRIKVGSSVHSPALAPLPAKFATLTEQLNTNPRKFDRCEDDVDNNGPDGAHTTFADCTGSSDWTFVLAIALDGGPKAAYPGSASLTATGTKKCASAVAAAGHDIYPEIPSAASWTGFDDRELDCWINNN